VRDATAFTFLFSILGLRQLNIIEINNSIRRGNRYQRPLVECRRCERTSEQAQPTHARLVRLQDGERVAETGGILPARELVDQQEQQRGGEEQLSAGSQEQSRFGIQRQIRWV